MKVKVQIVVEHDKDDAPIMEEVICLCRDNLRPETLGLTLEGGCLTNVSPGATRLK